MKWIAQVLSGFLLFAIGFSCGILAGQKSVNYSHENITILNKIKKEVSIPWVVNARIISTPQLSIIYSTDKSINEALIFPKENAFYPFIWYKGPVDADQSWRIVDYLEGEFDIRSGGGIFKKFTLVKPEGDRFQMLFDKDLDGSYSEPSDLGPIVKKQILVDGGSYDVFKVHGKLFIRNGDAVERGVYYSNGYFQFSN